MSRLCALVLIVMGLQAFSSSPTWAQVGDQSNETSAAESKPKPAKSAPVDPSGTWKWQYRFGDNTMDAKLKLNWDGKKLTGNYTAREATSDIQDAKLERDQLSFTTVREINGNEFEVQFKGQVKPEEIVGTVTVDFGQSRDFDWTAKRAVEMDDVLGVWNMQIDTPNGRVEPKLTITKGDNGKLKGTYESVFGKREAKNLALKDNQLTWEVSANDDDEFDFKIAYKGTPRGDNIEGTNEYEFGDNTGTMKFTGKRTPPKEKAGNQGNADEKADGEAANAGEPAGSASSDSSTSQ
jgi:hypothetical protein